MALNLNSSLGDAVNLKTNNGKSVISKINKGIDTSSLENIFEGLGKGSGLDPLSGKIPMSSIVSDIEKMVSSTLPNISESINSLTEKISGSLDSITGNMTKNLGVQNVPSDEMNKVTSQLSKTTDGKDVSSAISSNVKAISSTISNIQKTVDSTISSVDIRVDTSSIGNINTIKSDIESSIPKVSSNTSEITASLNSEFKKSISSISI